MNSKAIKRQLLAAIAMVLVAAIALGSSTYAWFVASSTVTAEGMKVQAQTDAGLTIRYQKGTWNTVASAAMAEAIKLFPASTTDLATWYNASAESANSYQAKVGTRKNISAQVFPSGTYTDNSYVLMRQFEIASTATDANALVSGIAVTDVTVTGSSKTMSTALRVGVQYGTEDPLIFAPVSTGEGPLNNPTTTYKVYKDKVVGTVHSDEEVGEVTVVTPSIDAVVVPTSVTIPAKTGNGILVNIYIWFEGEDRNLNTDNFATEELSVTVDFTGISTGEGTDINANKIKLTGATVTNASDTNKEINGVTYYLISGATNADGSSYTGTALYTTTTTLTSGSKIYTISDAGLVTDYTSNVVLPS